MRLGLVLLLLVCRLSGAVVIVFSEEEGNVVAMATGSMIVPSSVESSFSGEYLGVFGDGLLFTEGGVNRFGGGLLTGTGITVDPVRSEGSSFGFSEEYVYFGSSVVPGSLYSPDTVWIWEGVGLADIGLGDLGLAPVLAYTASNGQRVSLSAPEPSVGLLMGLGLLLACRRWRS